MSARHAGGSAATPAFALGLREGLPVWAALLALTALAWVVTIDQARAMAGMPECTGTMGLALLPFLGMWTAMMAAMMFPSVAPVAVLWSRAIAREGPAARRALRLALFVGGYGVAWSAVGALAWLGFLGLEALLARQPAAGVWVGAGIFAAAGLFQLTPWKDACLAHCRTPMAALAHYTAVRGRGRDFRVGLHHGLYCLGCCWGLMAILAAVGVMNVPAMVGLALLVFLEKTWRRGPLLARAAGVALLALAALAPAWPALLPGLPAAR